MIRHAFVGTGGRMSGTWYPELQDSVRQVAIWADRRNSWKVLRWFPSISRIELEALQIFRRHTRMPRPTHSPPGPGCRLLSASSNPGRSRMSIFACSGDETLVWPLRAETIVAHYARRQVAVESIAPEPQTAGTYPVPILCTGLRVCRP
jgi:hypothetical protein